MDWELDYDHRKLSWKLTCQGRTVAEGLTETDARRIQAMQGFCADIPEGVLRQKRLRLTDVLSLFHRLREALADALETFSEPPGKRSDFLELLGHWRSRHSYVIARADGKHDLDRLKAEFLRWAFRKYPGKNGRPRYNCANPGVRELTDWLKAHHPRRVNDAEAIWSAPPAEAHQVAVNQVLAGADL